MSQGNAYTSSMLHILECRTNNLEIMCEPPIKEDMFTGFTGEMENDKTEGEEDGGWMLSAYCGTEVLKKEFFYTLGKNNATKPYSIDCAATVSGSTQTSASSTLENKSFGTPTDSSVSDSNVSAQASATVKPLTMRKRTASYAFVSSEPESNNNKSQYGDAYGTFAAPKLPRLSSAEINEETAPQKATTDEDKDYIYENPYLIEYRDYDGEGEFHDECQEKEEEVFNYNQRQGHDDQFVQDMEYKSRELIRQRNCRDLSNQDTQIVIKEMKKTADFTMGEYNALATDLNRDVNEYSRGGRRRSPAQVEWWRITRHLELTCEYVILKLRNELRVDPRTNTRIKAFSRGGGNINQTLLSMSMGGGGGGGGGGGPPKRRNSDTLTKQQLTCVKDLNDLVKRVLHPKHCKKVKIGAIISLFYTIKQKFQLDNYETEILNYGIETMRSAMKKNQQADSPEVVRCIQEVCDLVKQMVFVRNSFSSAPVIHTHTHSHVPSLLDIQVSPPIKSRLFNRKLGEAMKHTLNCLMKLYKDVGQNDESKIEPKLSTSSASEDDHALDSAEPFSLDLHDRTTFPSASDSSSPSAEDLPVINTFSLGSTYDYSQENENETEAVNEEEKDNVARSSSPDDSVDTSQTAANDSPSPGVSEPVPCARHSSEDSAMLQQDVSDADKIVPNVEELTPSAVYSENSAASETACGEKDGDVTEETCSDEETPTATESKDNSVTQHKGNVTDENMAIAAQTETSGDDKDTDATTNIENVQNKGNGAEIHPPTAGDHVSKSVNVANLCRENQGCPAAETDPIETILEKTFPIEQDYVAEGDLCRDSGNVESRQKGGTSHHREETDENFTVQNEMALDLSMHKDDSNQDNGEEN